MVVVVVKWYRCGSGGEMVVVVVKVRGCSLVRRRKKIRRKPKSRSRVFIYLFIRWKKVVFLTHGRGCGGKLVVVVED